MIFEQQPFGVHRSSSEVGGVNNLGPEEERAQHMAIHFEVSSTLTTSMKPKNEASWKRTQIFLSITSWS